ncbi:helix-turn-helix transcriptional regulator [Lactobacillus sp. PV037]|uniref:helix-turn-helix domain-containing protein n=1 Tax=Lactobacillus sp. PV037 TaxID=2594496 RepID=UPI00223F4879|nr:helix-turn-helix transcriptional regulator [Lactobacillus sp. PV037]QNQ83809.1 helix-turn-helix transcriptional regulator [Lactobacillus sp. PV037]
MVKISFAAARKNANLRQEEAAKALKISKATLSTYENHPEQVTLKTLREMASLYKVPIEVLI